MQSAPFDYITEVGKGVKQDNLKSALISIEDLSVYLEKRYHLGSSIKNRREEEKKKREEE